MTERVRAPLLVIVSGAPATGKITLAASRHAAHFDAERLPDLRTQLADGGYEPLDLAIATLRVDTANGYTPRLDDILRFVLTAADVPA